MNRINEPNTGYRIVQSVQDTKRWQVRLFEHIRTAPAYGRLAGAEPEDAALALGLVFRGKPAAWAVEMIERDREGQFLSGQIPRTLTTVDERYVEISASLNRMNVATWNTDPGWTNDPVTSVTHRPIVPMQVGAEDWQRLEELAVQATRNAVQHMRDRFEHAGLSVDKRSVIKAGKESTKELQIERLAYQLTGRPTSPNPRMTVARWCKTLGIDAPRK